MVKIIHNIDDLPPLVQNFLTFTSKWKENYNIKINFGRSIHKITLSKIEHNTLTKFSRKIIISISLKPNFYSIELYEPHTNKNNQKEYEKTYSLNVQGNNNINAIIKDTERILNGKINWIIFNPNFPF